MKYLRHILLFTITMSFQPLLADTPSSAVGSFLIRDPETVNKKPSGLPSDPSENIRKTKTYLGVTSTTLFPPLLTCSYIGLIQAVEGGEIPPFTTCGKIFLGSTGLLISKRSSISDFLSEEYRFDLHPGPTGFFLSHEEIFWPFLEFTYQKITYNNPENSSSVYTGTGLGISTFQGLPVFITIGREMKRFSNHPSFVELQISVPFLILLPLFNCKLSCGLNF